MNPSCIASGKRLLPFVLFALFTLLLTPFCGPQPLDWTQVFGLHGTASADTLSLPDATIFWNVRVPRVLGGFLAGMSLALCGMAYQALFRNALATPYTLGVAGGAALGAALYAQLGLSFTLWRLSGGTLLALAGAMLVTAALALVSRLADSPRGKLTACLAGGQSGMTLLLAGVAFSFFTSSLLMFVQYVSDAASSYRILHWLMGGLDGLDPGRLLVLGPVACTGSVLLLTLAPELDLLACGSSLATSRGVDVPRVRALVFGATSVLVAFVVAFCGPIGFVGMMAPHMCRLWTGPEHRLLAPATLLFGGAFLCLCDALSRMVIAPAEMPVGIITALLGGPFFIWLLFRPAANEKM